MALTPMEQTKADRITDNLITAATKDIEKLSKAGYNFLYLASGFIAHYNQGGFIAHYGTAHNLADEILAYQDNNQWSNFHPNEKDYDYMMQKKDIYNKVCKHIKLFRSQPTLENDFTPHEYEFKLVFRGTGTDPESAMHKALQNCFIDLPGATVESEIIH